MDNVKIDLGRMRWDGVDWINAVMWWTECGNESSGFIKFWEVLDWLHI
jgi:hypothetical protein